VMNRLRKWWEEQWLLGVVVAAVILVVGLCARADAQPEMKVGQRWKCDCNTCTYEGGGYFTSTLMNCVPLEGAGGFRVDPDLFIEDKPAPRPEFKLPTDDTDCPDARYEGAAAYNNCILNNLFDAIADELRYLREEIKGLRGKGD